MAAPMDQNDSSSEDEESLLKLREAAVESGTLFNDVPQFDKSNKPHKTPNNLKSKRPEQEECEVREDDNLFNTTPGFRKHVAKKLSDSLESELDSTGLCFKCSLEQPADNNGVKLFSSSKNYLQAEQPTVPNRRKPGRKHQPSSSSDSSSEDERLMEASVSHDFIVQQSSLPYLNSNKPADVVIKDGESKTDKKDSINKKQKSDNFTNNKSETIKINQELFCDVGAKNRYGDITRNVETLQRVTTDMSENCALGSVGEEQMRNSNSCKKKKKKKYKKNKTD